MIRVIPFYELGKGLEPTKLTKGLRRQTGRIDRLINSQKLIPGGSMAKS